MHSLVLVNPLVLSGGDAFRIFMAVMATSLLSHSSYCLLPQILTPASAPSLWSHCFITLHCPNVLSASSALPLQLHPHKLPHSLALFQKRTTTLLMPLLDTAALRLLPPSTRCYMVMLIATPCPTPPYPVLQSHAPHLSI